MGGIFHHVGPVWRRGSLRLSGLCHMLCWGLVLWTVCVCLFSFSLVLFLACFCVLLTRHLCTVRSLCLVMFASSCVWSVDLLAHTLIKLGYSCTDSIEKIMQTHNRKILSTKPQNDNNNCNCWSKESCPIPGKCRTKTIIYQATVQHNNKTAEYIGYTEPDFKSRYNNHTHSFRTEKKQPPHYHNTYGTTISTPHQTSNGKFWKNATSTPLDRHIVTCVCLKNSTK